MFYQLDACFRGLNTDFTLSDCLFGAVKLTKNADADKYGYSGYGTWFDARSFYSLPYGECGKHFVIFGVDNSSVAHTHNRKRHFLVTIQQMYLITLQKKQRLNILLILLTQKRKSISVFNAMRKQCFVC